MYSTVNAYIIRLSRFNNEQQHPLLTRHANCTHFKDPTVSDE